jgi:hypothetical protein
MFGNFIKHRHKETKTKLESLICTKILIGGSSYQSHFVFKKSGCVSKLLKRMTTWNLMCTTKIIFFKIKINKTNHTLLVFYKKNLQQTRDNDFKSLAQVKTILREKSLPLINQTNQQLLWFINPIEFMHP